MAIESYFSEIKPGFSDRRDIEAMLQYVKGCIQHPENISSRLVEIIELVPSKRTSWKPCCCYPDIVKS